MAGWGGVWRDALVSGAVAGAGSATALAAAAVLEGKAPLQPLNATSHWRNGDGAGRVTGLDLRHTAVGVATNQAACLFWAVLFQAWLARRGRRRPVEMVRDGVVMAAVAAAVDYGATPKRFTPGWELVLSKRGIAVAYGGLAAGLAAGALLAQAWRPAR